MFFKVINIFFFRIALLLFPYNVISNEIVKIPKVNEPPVIDGKLDEAVWQKAAIFTDFKTLRPDFGLPPSEETKVYMVYDKDKIYLAFNCSDSEPDKIKANISRRDNIVSDDWIAFCLDTFNDELSAYFFGINPLGIQMDGTLNADGQPEITQDMIWKSAGVLSDDGYSAEIAIPFKTLRFTSKDNVVMGFKIARLISRKSEEVDFPEFHPEKGAALAQFQKIELSGIQTKQILEILPATTVGKKYMHQEGSMKDKKIKGEFSFTSKIGITSDMIVDATYNPDFSQIETDAGQIDVNLRYSVYYPEKRPFFMEGQERFNFAVSYENCPLGAVVHTRNIVNPILGIKLNGKVARNDIISAIYAQDEYHKDVESDNENNFKTNKNAHFSIFRYIRRLKKDSYIGGFYTGSNLSKMENYVLGIDGRIRINDKSFIEYHGFRSYSKRQDDDSYAGNALAAIYSHNSRRFNLQIGMNDVSKKFRTDVGYLRRNGVTTIPIYAQYSFFPSFSWLQRIEPYYWARHTKDKYSGLYESFNVFSVKFIMPWRTFINIQGCLANEVFEYQRFNRNGFRFEAEAQIQKQIFLECDIRREKLIYYDSSEPYQGEGTQAYFGLFLQPTNNISSGFDISFSDFYRESDNEKMYDYTIYRNRTIFQLNKYLFLRSVVEYNTFWKRINADFLVSFTYIPGTVVYLGYGSIYEKLEWRDTEYVSADNYLLTKKNFFFKASYLWRY
jgi:hypothetical protein